MTTVSPPDHYRVLGVDPAADTEAVRAAYLRLARRLHPDFHSDADAATRASLQRKMQQVNASWRLLRDPEERLIYDQGRRAAAGSTAAGRAGRAGRSSHTDENPPLGRSEIYDEVRSTYDSTGPSDPIRARLVALTVVALGVAVLFGIGWIIIGWRGFGSGLLVALFVAFGAFFSIPLSAVFSSYRSDRGL